MGVQVSEVAMQKCKLPSFFLTSMTALHQALWIGLMALDSNISLKWFLTSSTINGGICLNHSLNGVSSVTFMVCSVEWVHPSSAGSNENMSWYSARSWWALSANLGAHKSKPLRSNSLNSLPCLCLIINFEVWGSGHTSSWTCRLPGSGVMGICCTAIALATWGLLSESLGVGSAVPHHHYCLLAALPQFSIHILHSKARWQGAILGTKSLHHHVKMFSQVCLHCLHGYYMAGKRFQCLYFLCIH